MFCDISCLPRLHWLMETWLYGLLILFFSLKKTSWLCELGIYLRFVLAAWVDSNYSLIVVVQVDTGDMKALLFLEGRLFTGIIIKKKILNLYIYIYCVAKCLSGLAPFLEPTV